MGNLVVYFQFRDWRGADGSSRNMSQLIENNFAKITFFSPLYQFVLTSFLLSLQTRGVRGFVAAHLSFLLLPTFSFSSLAHSSGGEAGCHFLFVVAHTYSIPQVQHKTDTRKTTLINPPNELQKGQRCNLCCGRLPFR